jgi:hypothetical protein
VALDISEAEVWIEYPELAKPENYAMVQDELDLVLQRSDADDPEIWTQLCLRGLFTLYERLVVEESGWCLGFFRMNEVVVEDGRVRLEGQPALIGTVDEFEAVVRALITDVLNELESEGINSRAVCENMCADFERSEFDPVGFHAEVRS